MELTIKNVKTFRGREGHGFNATLYVDGKKAAFVMDGGNGGCMDFEWFINSAPVMAYAQSLPNTAPCEWFPEGLPSDLELIINKMVDDHLHNKRFLALSKKKTLFRIPGDTPGEWRTLSAPFSNPKVKPMLDEHYPNGYTVWSPSCAF